MLDDHRGIKYNLLPRYIQEQAYIVKHNIIHKHLCQNHRDSNRHRHGNHPPRCSQVLYLKEME